MATFLRLHELVGNQAVPRLVNMDHVRHTYAFPGPPPYVQLNMTDGKAICVRETHDDIAALLSAHRK